MTFTASALGLFDAPTRDLSNPFSKITIANFGTAATLAQRQTAQAELLKDGYDFVITARSDGNAETGVLIDLTANGVTFPAGSMRSIDVETWITGDSATTERGHFTSRYTILGGSPPVDVLDLPIQVSTNMAGTFGGFTGSDPSVTTSISGNLVRLLYTNEGAAEINNVICKVYCHKLVPFIAGV